MDKRFEQFIREIEIDEEDIPKAKKFIEAKGIEKHILIKQALESWNKGAKVTYAQIATAYRYDKRIRFVLFKYISFLEEWWRGAILDKAKENEVSINWVDSINALIQKYHGDVNRALEDAEFSALKNQCLQMSELKIRLGFSAKLHLRTNLNAIVMLRNAVMHNKLLLLYRGFNKCFVEGANGSTLAINIKNLVEFLPKEIKGKCAKEIEACAVDRNEERDTRWELLDVLNVC